MEKKSDEKLAVSCLGRGTVLILIILTLLSLSAFILEGITSDSLLWILIAFSAITMVFGPVLCGIFLLCGLVFAVCNLRSGTVPKKYWILAWAVGESTLYFWVVYSFFSVVW